MTVAILMALYEGERHLQAQLDSFREQTHRDWHLIVSDDGSKDGGPAILRGSGLPVTMIEGPRQGFAQNFLHLLTAAGDAPYAALSDQDDVWLPEKLARAVDRLSRLPAGRPVLYCARTIICGPDLQPVAQSPRWRRPFGFANALVQNVAAGNTIVLNRAALDLAQAAVAAAAGISAHDWWLYQIVTGAGGLVVRDDAPVLLYRQHEGNQMGRNDTARAALSRLSQIADGTFRRWIDANIAALMPLPMLTTESRTRLMRFAEAREAPLAARLRGLRRAGIYRQTRAANAAMWGAAAAGKL